LPSRAGVWAAAALGRLPGGAPPAEGEPLAGLLACCLALDLLDVETLSCEPLPLGTGPASAAARAALGAARGLPIRGVDAPETTLGPLGVALVAALCASWGPAPRLVVESSGLGFDALGRPALEAVLGRAGVAAGEEELVVLAANLDDLAGEILGTLVDECLGAGALDAWLVPALMKKGRPGHVLEALCRSHAVSAVEERLFRCSSTLGVRRTAVTRRALERRWQEAQTPWGPVRVKLGLLRGEVVNRAPEYEDCRRVAAAARVPLKEVYAGALAALPRR
jgi:hypothetical protein